MVYIVPDKQHNPCAAVLKLGHILDSILFFGCPSEGSRSLLLMLPAPGDDRDQTQGKCVSHYF